MARGEADSLTLPRMSLNQREETLEGLVLAVIEGDTASRPQASEALWEHVDDWVPEWLLRVIAWPAWMPRAERAEIAQEACEHLVLKCGSRNVGAHQRIHRPSAWACSVLRH